MNDDERKALNKRVAIKYGWKPTTGRHGHWENDWVYESSDGGYVYSQGGPPDFVREWDHAGPLFEKLLWRKKDPELVLDEILIIREQSNCDLIAAVTIAYDAWEVDKQ